MQLHIDMKNSVLRYGEMVFDPWTMCWQEPAVGMLPVSVSKLRAVNADEAVRWLFQTANVRRVPIAVIGAKVASEAECGEAEALGAGLARVGYTLLTGGRTGVMEAASRGAFNAGGLVLGFLPGEGFETANPYVTVPLATGVGPARNSIIAQSARVLVAVAGGYGTITEMAYGLHYGRPVFALPSAPDVPGVVRCNNVDEVLAGIASAFLGLQSLMSS
ncbi:TIGR00725 family protein [Thalassospira marina]|uniref:TIGR00725 family protein n=2 Tax=Thalassospira marina TaxID=2048283 RepID=A0A2N3KYP8_9PROT|nr:TIGR00725 family protein [Thalassospira marina]